MLAQAITQAHLERVLHDTFIGENVVLNARKKVAVKNPKTGYFLELDIWIPKLRLAFEFQDAYHYATTWYNQNPLTDIKTTDYKKNEDVLKRDITLVHVPCWWDAKPASLLSTVRFMRPDILPHVTSRALPIQINPPDDFFVAFSVPDVGEMMLTAFVESPLRFAETIDSENSWWLGEKYDGIRCIWNQRKKALYNKTGIELALPRVHTASCAHSGVFMDGEVWSGRGLYVEALKIMGANDIDWPHLRVVAFDNPGPLTQDLAFEERYLSLLLSIDPENSFLILAARLLCVDKYMLSSALHRVIDGAGEGVILRKPESVYERGRSNNLVKLKASRGDTEALVVRATEDTLVLQMPNGITFEVDSEYSHVAPKNGQVVTLEYESYSRKSAPVNPVVVRIRTDLRWEDVVADFVTSMQTTGSEVGFTTKPRGYWREDDGKHLRNFFEDFARNKGLDPLLPATWYAISGSFVSSQKDYSGVMSQKGGYIKALLEAFPDIGLEEKHFSRVPSGYWENMQNRKTFFVNFAKKQQFDPLVPNNWYDVRDFKELEDKSAGILQYYQGSLVKALLHLFPDIGLLETKFPNMPKGYWSNTENRRIFFDAFAREQGFDPLLPQNWYSVTWRNIKGTKGKNLLRYYDGQSVITALLDVYPNIGLELTKFSLPNNYWADPARRKSFFDIFASENKFDPLVADNWYSVSPRELRKLKSYNSILQYHEGGLVIALMSLYPDIGLSSHKFLLKRREKHNKRML